MAKLELNYPVFPYKVNQEWGENNACVINFGESNQKVIAVENGKICPPGYEKLYPLFDMRGHNGLDLQAGVQPVYAAHAGVVNEKQTVPARGLGLGILSHERFTFEGYGEYYARTRYWHLQRFTKEVGDIVKVGDIIGYSDNTGYSSGNHLHFELNLFDKDEGGHPMQLIKGDTMIAGSIDPALYWTGFHAKDYQEAYSLSELAIQLMLTLISKLKALKK